MSQPGTAPARPPRNAFDRKAVGWWRAGLAIFFCVVVAVLLAAALVPGLPSAGNALRFVPAAIAVLLGLLAVLLLPRWWYRVHRWEITDTAVYVRSGFFWRAERVAPICRIQNVDTMRGPLQKQFDLATLTVTTASAKGALKIEGLNAGMAAELARELTEAGRGT